MANNFSLDHFKVLLAFMVVGIHCGLFSESMPAVSFVLNQGIFRVAVPFFFMVSGFYFCDVVARGQVYAWFKRVFIMYALWMIVYAPYWFELDQVSVYHIARLLHTCLFGYFHLWYLSALLGAALLILLVRDFPLRCSVITATCMLLGCVTFEYLGNFHVFHGRDVDDLFNKTWLYKNFLFIGFPFFLMGYVVNSRKIVEKFRNAFFINVFVFALVFMFAEISVNYKFVSVGETFDMLYSLVVVVPSMFLLVMKNNSSVRSKEVSLYSVAIYLIHPLFVVWLGLFVFNSLVTMFLVVFCTAAVGFVVVKLHQRFGFLL